MISDQVQRPVCESSGCVNPAKKNGISVRGFQKYKKLCSGCDNLRRCGYRRGSKYKKAYQKYRRDSCEECGFLPTHKCQLDVDHIDGNRNNNHPSNLQTLCANCHRLKTYLNKDWETKPTTKK